MRMDIYLSSELCLLRDINDLEPRTSQSHLKAWSLVDNLRKTWLGSAAILKLALTMDCHRISRTPEVIDGSVEVDALFALPAATSGSAP